MKTQTGYYGETEYNPSDLIVVAEGFFGFPELKQFLPLRLDEDNDSLLLMQSVENSQVAFVVIAPTILCPDIPLSLQRKICPHWIQKTAMSFPIMQYVL